MNTDLNLGTSSTLKQRSKSLGEIYFRTFVFWMSFCFFILTITLPFFRYLFYVVPLLVIFSCLGDKHIRIGREILPFLLLLICQLILSPMANTLGYKDIFFIYAGISISFIKDIPSIALERFFKIVVSSALIYYSIFGDFSNGFQFDIEKSQSTLEGNFGFVFGLIAIAAILHRRWWLVIFSALLAVLALKRIVLLAILIAGCAAIFGERRMRLALNPFTMILINVALVVSIMGYGSGFFDQIISDKTGQSANQFGQGRRAVLEIPAIEIARDPIRALTTGFGSGSAYYIVAKVQHAVIGGNLHSDLIKIVYELGLPVFIIFIAAMYSSKSYGVRIFYLYFNILLLTDNTLIYYYFLFAFAVLARNELQLFEKNTEKLKVLP